ncbi:hypothetical protein [Mycobacterium lepromatosis]|nr:hypothetical protein [Mycobacterium lepromatosis]
MRTNICSVSLSSNVKGIGALINAVHESNVRETLATNSWRIDFLGPAT